MTKNSDNKFIYVHGTEDNKMKISKPLIKDFKFSITLEIPKKYNYNNIDFIPYGNKCIIYFVNSKGKLNNIWEYTFNLWIDPKSIIGKFKSNISTLVIEGELINYQFKSINI